MGTTTFMAGRLPPRDVRLPLSLQRWDSLTFLHWSYPPHIVQPLLPSELAVDTWDGAAWVSVTPFEMQRVRAPGLPPPPGWSAFPETNLRTYVGGGDGRDGLWFLSLDAARSTFVHALRGVVGLPYHHASMRVDRADSQITYRSQRRDDPRAHSHVSVRIGHVLASDDFVDFLTGRWGAYSVRCRQLLYTPVTHPPWPLHTASVERCEMTLLPAAGLPEPHGRPLAHYSPGVNSRIGCPRLVRAR